MADFLHASKVMKKIDENKLKFNWSNNCSRMNTMSDTIESSVTDLHLAYQLMVRTKLLEARNKGDKTGEKAAKDELEKDGADISEGAKSAHAASVSPGMDPTSANVDINLSTFAQNIKAAQDQTQQVQMTQVVSVEQTVETDASLTYHELEKIDGLVVKNKNLAETDRYSFEFSNGSTLKITDKWSNRSTTIYGDPHVDTSDGNISSGGDFKDLTASDQYTTFMLSDGTRLTFTAKDNSLIENVDIFKGDQHLSGIGAGSKSWSDDTGLFASSVKNDAVSASSAVPVGDMVYAGGDGNDWFDASKRLVWGKTTGPTVTTRPSSYIEFQYNQRITQQVSVVQVNQQV
jgi:hypothetical protein